MSPSSPCSMTAKISLSLLMTVLLYSPASYAQTYQPSNRIPVADNTLGTQVTGANNNFNITGGLTRGQSVLHSFQDFSVPTGGSATFTSPTGTQAIITRVTGNVSSDINGIVNTQGANFFLINPSGVVFGPGAQLNVGKAFVTSTANSANLTDNSAESSIYLFGTKNINDAPLLRVNPNVSLNVDRLNLDGGNGAIVNYGTIQTNNNSQYIALIGGDITLNAGAGRGNIVAPGGRVDLGGLRSAGTVGVNAAGFNYGAVDQPSNNSTSGFVRNDVTFIDGAQVAVATSQPVGNVNTFFFGNATTKGSNINIDANNVRIVNRSPNEPAPPIRFREPITQPVTPGELGSNSTINLRARRVALLANDRQRIVQACDAGNSKLTITGRGGLPPNANEPLGSDVVWRDPRVASGQPVTQNNSTPPPSKFPPPAVGWILDQQGNVALLAAQSADTSIGAKAICPPPN